MYAIRSYYADGALRRDHFAELRPVEVGIGAEQHAVDVLAPRGLEAVAKRRAVIDDRRGAQRAAPVGAFRPRRGGEDLEAEQPADLDRHP